TSRAYRPGIERLRRGYLYAPRAACAGPAESAAPGRRLRHLPVGGNPVRIAPRRPRDQTGPAAVVLVRSWSARGRLFARVSVSPVVPVVGACAGVGDNLSSEVVQFRAAGRGRGSGRYEAERAERPERAERAERTGRTGRTGRRRDRAMGRAVRGRAVAAPRRGRRPE